MRRAESAGVGWRLFVYVSHCSKVATHSFLRAALAVTLAAVVWESLAAQVVSRAARAAEPQFSQVVRAKGIDILDTKYAIAATNNHYFLST